MRFSMSLPILRQRDQTDPYGATFELARLAEAAGFDTVTTGHHHFQPGIMSDPLTFLAAVAAQTSTVRVGTGIFVLPLHHPLRVAEQVATIDEISGGRISLGVGLGWSPLEYDTFADGLSQRGARMDEALEILRRAWTEDSFSHNGRFWNFSELGVYPKPIQDPHPPLWVAGVADAAVLRAARLGDAWLCGPVQSQAVAQRCLKVYRAERARLGLPDEWILRRYAWVGKDHDQVREQVLPGYVDGLMAHWRESAEDDSEHELFARLDRGENVPPEEIAADRLLWGEPAHVIQQIRSYQAATGCEHIHASLGAGLSAEDSDRSSLGEFDDMAEMIELFGHDVIPAFR